MIKYIDITNFNEVENRVLSYPEQPYITDRFKYYLEPVGECARLRRQALRNSEGIKRAKQKRLHFILRRI
jgi:hypothetical protein